MNWLIQPDQPEYGIFARRWTEDKKWEICISRVMFGWRIRFGRAGVMTYEFDWCAGDLPANIEGLYSHLCMLIRTEGAEHVAATYPETSRVKPYINDSEFINLVFHGGAMPVKSDHPIPELNRINLQAYTTIFLGYYDVDVDAPVKTI